MLVQDSVAIMVKTSSVIQHDFEEKKRKKLLMWMQKS